MSKKPPIKIEDVRAEIDRVDNALLSLIAERLELAAAVRRAKSGVRFWRPSREESHIRELAAATEDTPPELVSRIWAELMSASIALQGPMKLHIALQGDMLDVWTLVRDRFGAAIPAVSYPTASSALAAAYGDDEGVAVLPAPGGMNSWWTALGARGAMPDMHILSGLPRTGDEDWPRAVAVSTADIQPSGADQTLLICNRGTDIPGGELRAEAGQETVLIIGGGLIGSSIARAAKTYGQAEKVFISDNSSSACETIERLGFADGVAPPGRIGEVAKAIIPVMKDGAILSDVGSIKGDVIKQVTPYLKETIHFVPGHPIAGTEYSGPEAGFAELFQERWCVLTPDDADESATEVVKTFWEGIGALVAIMDSKRHDIVLATTSHVPHLIAYTLVGTAVDMETVTNNEVVKFSAGGFRDFTRIASSDPVMWRDVFLANRDATLEVVDRFIEDLSALKRAIRWEDGDALLEHFAKTRDIRRRIVDAGQDSSAPNFGRDD